MSRNAYYFGVGEKATFSWQVASSGIFYHVEKFFGMVCLPRVHQNHAEVFVSDYSYRNATMGSTFAARRAGTKAAMPPSSAIAHRASTKLTASKSET